LLKHPGSFWLGILGSALPWIIAVPIVLAVSQKIGINGEGQSAAGIGSIMAVFFAIAVAFAASFFVNIPEASSTFSYFFYRSLTVCAIIYTLIFIAEIVGR
jgi:hypothetical protein